jgi:excisionase family DNA binding protein
MTQKVEQNTKDDIRNLDVSNFISAAEAGKLVGYTGDYISKLAREGKIDATRVGRQWMVSPKSVKDYVVKTEVEKKERSIAIRQERKEEQQMFADGDEPRNILSNKHVAILHTAVILILGLSVGASGYFVSTTAIKQQASLQSGGMNVIEEFARTLYRFISPEEQVEIVYESETVLPNEEPTDSSSGNSFVVGTSEVFASETVDEIRESFSDDVIVVIDKENPDTGIITPVFKDRVGEEYRFLMVPNP